jgi:hypothetical protein
VDARYKIISGKYNHNRDHSDEAVSLATNYPLLRQPVSVQVMIIDASFLALA